MGNEYYQRLVQLIEDMPEAVQEREFAPGTMNRNIRDVLGHLHHWHLLFLNWYEAGMKGDRPEMPSMGYTWKMTPQLNRDIQEMYRDVPLKKTKKLLADSYAKVQAIVQKHTNAELFEKKKYKWTGTTSLGSYLVSATSSHYDWAYKLIKRVMR